MILHGCAVGGGSITYACTGAGPAGLGLGARVVGRPGAVEAGDAAHYETAMRMLGVAENRILGPADHL
jgi:cholesterol oxidase